MDNSIINYVFYQKNEKMKKFFINNGYWLTGALTLIFFVMTDLTGDYLPKFSNWYLEMVTYLIIVSLPVSLSIYYRNKK